MTPPRSHRIVFRSALTSTVALALAAGLGAGCQVSKSYDQQQVGTTTPGSGEQHSASTTPPATASNTTTSATATSTPRQTAQEKQVEDYAKLGYRLEWIGYATVLTGHQVKMASVMGDILAVQDNGNALTAINVADGSARWAQMLDIEAANFMGLTRIGPNLAVASESNVFMVSADNGTILSKQKLARVASTPPAVLGQLLVFGTSGGQVTSHDTRNGERPWAYMINGPVQFEPVVVGESGVGVVSTSGQVMILNAASGTLMGNNQMFGGIAAKPAADANTLYVASLDQSLYAYNAAGGGARWRIRTEEPLRGEPVVHGGAVYVQMPEGFAAIDAATGKRRWANEDVSGTLAAISKGRGIVWDGSTATTLDMKTGQVVDRVPLPSGSMLKPERFDGGALYVITPSGQVIKLVPRG